MTPSWRQKTIDLILTALLGLGLYFIAVKFFFLLFPLFLALLFSEIIRKGFARLRPISKGVKKTLIVLSLLIFFALISLLGILLIERLIRFVTTLSQGIGGQIDSLILLCENFVHQTEKALSDLMHRDMDNTLWNSLPNFFENFLNGILAAVPKWIAALVSFVPKFLVSLFIFVLATYYFSCDWGKLSRPIAKKISPEGLEKILSLKKRFFRGLKQSAKAYLLLFLMTFSELFLGFSIIKIQGAFEKALVIALIDLLPVFGCGTVLIPWAFASLLFGNTSRFLSLLVLYLFVFLIRQIAEPKIVGDSIGLHPVISLVLVIAGLSLFGFAGMILLPLTASCLIDKERADT